MVDLYSVVRRAAAGQRLVADDARVADRPDVQVVSLMVVVAPELARGFGHAVDRLG